MAQTMEELFIDELKDLYDGEQQIIEALPKMAEAASSSDLKTAFRTHLKETREHVARLEQVFQLMGAPAKTKSCKGIKGLLAEGEEIITKGGDPEVLDAALIGAAQKVEHYEIAGYGTLRTWATVLGHADCCKLLQMTLEEEGATDHKLTALAEKHINREAAGTERKAA